MTTNDWIQIVLYFGVLIALTKPLGMLYGPRVRGQALRPRPRAGLARAAHLPTFGRRSAARNVLARVRGRHAPVQLPGIGSRLFDLAIAGRAATQSAALGR